MVVAKSRCVSALAITVLLWIACVPTPMRAADQAADFQPAIERSLFDLLNQERVKAGLPELKWSDQLVQSARAHAQRMAAVHMLSHRVADEPVLMNRIAATGLRFNASAENIAYATDPDDIHRGWMQSGGHRANILSPKYDSVGIGVLRAGEVFYAVQNFAHTTSEDSASAAESRLAASFNKLRSKAGLPLVQISSDAQLRQAACNMARSNKLDAKLVPMTKRSGSAIAFNASEPEQIPNNFLELSTNPHITSLSVGACYMATESYPGGSYWFGVVY